ncbi:hypothetical protein KBC55_04610 [Patescibacteria group bacterium]|nr:hypothetical protein [Patescibacteria group bacterium]
MNRSAESFFDHDSINKIKDSLKPPFTEKREFAFEIDTVVDDLFEKECAQRDRAHDVLAELARELKRSGRDIPRSLKVSLFSIMLLSAETAMAQSQAANTVETSHEGYTQGPELPPETKEVIKELHEQDAQLSVSTSKGEVPINLDQLSYQLVFPDQLSRILVTRHVMSDDIVDTDLSVVGSEKGWELRRDIDYDNNNEILIANLSFLDKHGNAIFINRQMNPSGSSYEEKISYFPQLFREAESSDPLGVKFDVSTVANIPDVSDLVAHPTYALVGRSADVPIYNTSKLSDQELVHIVSDYSSSFNKGIQESSALFGLEADFLKHISIASEGRRNAHAWQDTVIISAENFLPKIDNSDIGQNEPSSLDNIEDIVKHEILHIIDAKFGISSSSAMQKVFLSSPHDTLHALSEEAFNAEPSIYGGHAGDSATELFASVVNGLDDERWEQQVLALQPHQRDAYFLTIFALKKTLDANKDIHIESPIRALLEKRCEYVSKI